MTRPIVVFEGKEAGATARLAKDKASPLPPIETAAMLRWALSQTDTDQNTLGLVGKFHSARRLTFCQAKLWQQFQSFHLNLGTKANIKLFLAQNKTNGSTFLGRYCRYLPSFKQKANQITFHELFFSNKVFSLLGEAS